MRPFLKWAGGKRQLLPQINSKLRLVNIEDNSYYEPFVGAGAVFLDLESNNVHINDINKELLNVYNVIKKSPEALIRELRRHARNNNSEYYYQIREMDRKDNWGRIGPIKKAARTIYLNRTCFNGLYRVNSRGEFNVPYGKYANPTIADENNLYAISEYLNRIQLHMTSCDFADAVATAQRGDFVYFDPPYDVLSDTSSFTAYTKEGFDRDDQERLKELVDNLTERGVYVLISNSATDFIMNLYTRYQPYTKIVQANRNINSRGDRRGKVDEVLIDNFEQVNENVE